jgi:hypothetical protein
LVVSRIGLVFGCAMWTLGNKPNRPGSGRLRAKPAEAGECPLDGVARGVNYQENSRMERG